MDVMEILEHAGVKGMRWGVRKRETSSSSSQLPSDDHIRAVLAGLKPTHALSNTEMQLLIGRMNLEKQYTSAIAAATPASRAAKVTKFVKTTLADIGKEQATRLARAEATRRTNAFGKSKGLDIPGLLGKKRSQGDDFNKDK